MDFNVACQYLTKRSSDPLIWKNQINIHFSITYRKENSKILIFYGHFSCLKQCVPKAPYHSPVRCKIVRQLDGELIRARGSQNHRGTGYAVDTLRPTN